MSSETSGSSGSGSTGGRLYQRDSAEFGRVLAFSDGLFAIAMTLLVIGIGVPDLADEDSVSDLADALRDLQPELLSFVISFAVIGRYWLAHHTFVGNLRALDSGLIRLNLIYLGFIAFLPFPTALLGEIPGNPLSVAVYAVSVAAVSGMEVVLMRRAHLTGLMEPPLSPQGFRWAAIASLSPVVWFTLSIPIAFVSTTAAICVWLIGVPAGILMGRYVPEEVEDELSRLQ